jgi:hypothetical protein
VYPVADFSNTATRLALRRIKLPSLWRSMEARESPRVRKVAAKTAPETSRRQDASSANQNCGVAAQSGQ